MQCLFKISSFNFLANAMKLFYPISCNVPKAIFGSFELANTLS